MALVALPFLAGCGDANVPQPSVTSVSISPNNEGGNIVPVVRGGNGIPLVATVAAGDGVSTEVAWTITGAANPGNVRILPVRTYTGEPTRLFVDASETAETLTVIAASRAAGGVYSTLVVTVVDGAPEVTGVTVSPSRHAVIRGRSWQFTAVVDSSFGAPGHVDWTVAMEGDGNPHSGTVINATGLLYVHEDEEADTLIVTATSRFDPEQYGTATVTVRDPIENIWVVGDMNPDNPPSDWGLPGLLMERQADGTFIWEGNASAGDTFRFSLQDTDGWTHPWNGPWFAPYHFVAGGVPISLDDNLNAMYFFDTNQSPSATEATNNTWRIPSNARYTFIVDPNAMTLRVEWYGELPAGVWVIGDMTGWDPPAQAMTREANGTFTWQGNLTGTTNFRFHQTPGNPGVWNRSWFIPIGVIEYANIPAIIGTDGNSVQLFNGDVSRNWQLSQGNFRFILDLRTMILTVESL